MSTTFVPGRLMASGWRAWSELVSVTAGWRACWADLDGWHQATHLPRACPWTSTLWAWTPDETIMIRARVNRDVDNDEATVVMAWLSTDPAASVPAGWRDDGELEVRVQTGIEWPGPSGGDTSRVKIRWGTQAWGAQRWRIYDVLGGMPVTLVSASTNSDRRAQAAAGTPA
ncbi:hypothetical protein [Phytoactinopolyspora limicola]|uniref:hypothetical protein n=1 Tax=Phytoactinopolyspora limicola TaxID=2715536 RepID=UPI0014086EAE|nr:hypothetical protein [Phytoactinopolyspora limicola]